MRLLLDENVPRPLHQVLMSFVLNHDIVHLLDLPGWSGTRDETYIREPRMRGSTWFSPMMVVRCSDLGKWLRSPHPASTGSNTRTSTLG